MRDLRFIALLVAITSFLFLFSLGSMALTDPDETFYAQTAKEMYNAHDWVTPRIFGQPQFEKPALYYWLVMLSYTVFGIGEFAARFPSAIFGILGVIGVYFLGRTIFSPLTGFLSGLALATSAQYIILSRACVTDMVLMAFILFSLAFFIKAWITEKKIYYIASSIMAALAVLTKGPIGLFIPGAIILLYLVLSHQIRELKKIPIFWCIFVFFIISLPWYIAVTRIHGDTFTGHFFGFQNVTRFLHPEHRIGISPFFYIPVIIAGLFPWTIFLFFGAQNMRKGTEDICRIKGCRLFLLLWFLVVFIFFSISRTKLVTYIFPLFPVMAIVVGRFWESFTTGAKEIEKRMKIAYYVFAATGLLAAVGIYIFVRYEYAQAAGGVIITEAIFLAGLILSTILFIFRKTSALSRLLPFFVIIFSVMLLVVPLNAYVLPVVEEFESSKALALEVKKLAAPNEAIGGECDHRRGIAFYTNRSDIIDIHPHDALYEFIERSDRVWGIIQVKHYRQIKEDRPLNVSREPLAQSGKYVLINNKPLDTSR